MTTTKWDHRFMRLAGEVARWSKDPSLGVGAVIVRPDKTVAAMGFNGFPRGCIDDRKDYEHRPTKLHRMVHAELNAILTAREPLHGYQIYCSGHPCSGCAGAIIQAGITRVMYRSNPELEARWRESVDAAAAMFAEAGVILVGME
jgi:dCMP deaminase